MALTREQRSSGWAVGVYFLWLKMRHASPAREHDQSTCESTLPGIEIVLTVHY
jgi:hypothetical protein